MSSGLGLWVFYQEMVFFKPWGPFYTYLPRASLKKECGQKEGEKCFPILTRAQLNMNNVNVRRFNKKIKPFVVHLERVAPGEATNV